MQPDTLRCALCECTVFRRREFRGVTWRATIAVDLCDSCNRLVVREATTRDLPRTFRRPRPVIIPAPSMVLVEVAREISEAVRG